MPLSDFQKSLIKSASITTLKGEMEKAETSALAHGRHGGSSAHQDQAKANLEWRDACAARISEIEKQGK